MTDFRTETRRWIAANLPPSMSTAMPPEEIPWGGRKARFPNPDTRLWLDRMAEKGWTAATWPTALGGGSLDPDSAAILAEELALADARPALFSFGLWMLAPVLLEFGTEAQQRRFLPPIARGEVRWCQGYSEPDAGSDLAALKMRAEDCGDHWLLNGQKVWTTYADESDWIFCLARTEPSLPKHKGISFILVDLASEGVTVRPIQLISGASPFCETFFDDVKVPKEHLIGSLNGGWPIAKKLLEYERQNVSAVGFGGDRSLDVADIARRIAGVDDGGRIADSVLRERVACQRMMDRAVELATRRMQREVDAGRSGASSSIVKVASAKTNQSRHELVVEMLGLDGLGWSGDGFAESDLAETRKWLRSMGNSIEGGTSEINLNVLAKQVLGLPTG